MESEPTTLSGHIDYFLKAFFITDICFWTLEYDKRVEFEIQSRFNNAEHGEKVSYITGSIANCVTDIKPDVVFYPVINDDMWKLSRANKAIVFVYPTYGFNIADNKLLKGQTDDDDNVGTYPIIQSSSIHFMG